MKSLIDNKSGLILVMTGHLATNVDLVHWCRYVIPSLYEFSFERIAIKMISWCAIRYKEALLWQRLNIKRWVPKLLVKWLFKSYFFYISQRPMCQCPMCWVVWCLWFYHSVRWKIHCLSCQTEVIYSPPVELMKWQVIHQDYQYLMVISYQTINDTF